jgi:osmoprotectant transport system substrate-binding protein
MLQHSNKGRHRGVPALRVVLLATLVAAAIAAATAGAAPQQKLPVTIGSKDFTEQFVLAELYGQALEHAGFDVKIKRNLGSTTITDSALRKGDIDVYAEYTGTMYLYICKLPYKAGLSFAALYKGDQRCYAKRGLKLLKPGTFNDGNAIACTSSFSKKNRVTKISDLRRVMGKTRYATIAEQLTAPNGVPWIKKHYGVTFGTVKTYDVGLRYQAVAGGDADCVYAFGTDPQIADLKLVVLKDDKRIWPFDHATPLVRPAWFKKQDPAFNSILTRINTKLTDKAMTALNAKVDIDKEDPADVAKAWLDANGFLK